MTALATPSGTPTHYIKRSIEDQLAQNMKALDDGNPQSGEGCRFVKQSGREGRFRKIEKNALHTKDSYSYIGVKDTDSTSGCTVRLAQGCVDGLKGVTVKSANALMTAVTQQLVSVVVDADSVFIPFHS